MSEVRGVFLPADKAAKERTGWARIRAYCTCGAKLDASSDPPEASEFVHESWRDLHSGPGHEPCDASTAYRARRKRMEPSA